MGVIGVGILITAYSFIAAVIGAGFASGQEILSFFVVHGKWGGLGIALSAVLFGGFTYIILNACLIFKTDDYGRLSEFLLNKKIRKLSDILIAVFMLCSLAVMTACFSETVYLIFGADKAVSAALFALGCGIVTAFGADKALKLNGVLGMIISVGVVSSVLYLLRYREHSVFAPQVSAVISGAGYSGYNLIGMGVILASMSKNIRSRGEAAAAGIISGVSLFVMMGLIFGLLSIYYKYINLGEIPILTLAMRENKVITCIYGVMLSLAVVTTAISDIVGITEITGFKSRYAAFFIAFSGLAVSCAGFSALINTAYRICGYAGIILTLYFIKRIKNAENKR